MDLGRPDSESVIKVMIVHRPPGALSGTLGLQRLSVLRVVASGDSTDLT